LCHDFDNNLKIRTKNMAKNQTKAQTHVVNKVYMTLSVIVAVLLLFIGGLASWASSFTTNMVRTELAAQKVYFPKLGDPSFAPATYPDLQQYAGQLVDNAPAAKAYANGFIGRHLAEVAGGKVYSEVSALAMKDPTNATLAKQKATLFQGDTLRGLLLGDGYAYGTIGHIAGVAAHIAFVGSAVMILAAGVFAKKARN
jgi:hypothetical protein